jgi:hydroxymethylpyrimidine pyrophosphatase-like HAD family hydrolase
MALPHSVVWNQELRLVLSDVDETVADLYRPAESGMLAALTRLLDQGIILVLITGQSVTNVEQRVVMNLPAQLRQQIAVGACSGAELWGYSTTGERNATAFYAADSVLTAEQTRAWRVLTQQLITEFRLTPFPPMPIADFKLEYGEEPWHVMLDDRGAQITIEFPNAFDLSNAACEQVHRRLGSSFEGQDLRIPVLHRAQQLLGAHSVPVTPRIAGMFALDLAIAGVDKARAVEEALTPAVLRSLGFGSNMPHAAEIEVWGDRFSQFSGTDWLMCKPIDRRVRALSFRNENPAEFPNGYNIRLWDGAYRLHMGLLEYLESRGEL